MPPLWVPPSSKGGILLLDLNVKPGKSHWSNQWLTCLRVTRWRRPGKVTGISATTNFGNSDFFYNFSSNGHPFEEGKAYSKFAAYATLKHGGDFRKAASQLAREGYGEGSSTSSYKATRGGLCWLQPTKNGHTPVTLTNFTARITRDVVEDDGVEERHFFDIEAKLKGRSFQFALPAKQFSSMQWILEKLGGGAIIAAGYGAKDRTREAIQQVSGNVPTQHVYTHIGWRKIEGTWVYLHAGGSIGPIGPIPQVETRLEGALIKYDLPDPRSEKAEVVKAVQASLCALDVAPSVAYPIYCSIFRATLEASDSSIYLAGPTGTGKSELAALAQQHYGSGMDRLNLPASWSSTENALEGLAFGAKDALLVIDDFCPTGSIYDKNRLHKAADRVLRAQGNQSGRQRMRSDATLRPERPARGSMLCTGEDIPSGQSLRARMLILEVSPGDMNWEKLSHCQADGANGLYTLAMAGFIQWLASQYESLRSQFK